MVWRGRVDRPPYHNYNTKQTWFITSISCVRENLQRRGCSQLECIELKVQNSSAKLGGDRSPSNARTYKLLHYKIRQPYEVCDRNVSFSFFSSLSVIFQEGPWSSSAGKTAARVELFSQAMAVPIIEEALVVIGIDDPDFVKNWRGLHHSHQTELVVWRGIGMKSFTD